MWRLLVLGLACLSCLQAYCLDPARAISQYAHTAWRNRDGYFASAPTAIAQTRDGYIWIGTIAGLVRFDGVRFAPWRPPQGSKTQPTSTIVSLFASKDGSLWIGTAIGLERWFNGAVTTYPDALGHINSILEDHEGHVWITRSRVEDGKGPLCEVTGAKLRCFGTADGIPDANGECLAIDPAGNFWIGGDGYLLRWRPGSTQSLMPETGSESSHRAGVQTLAAGHDGGMWAGFFGAGAGLGLQRIEGDQWHSVAFGAFNASSLQVTSLLLDSSDSLWIGTESDGIYRIHDSSVEHFNTSDGLSGDNVNAFFEDEEHDIWVATSTGIDSFRDLPVVSYTRHEGLTADQVSAVYASSGGTIWIGNVGGLDMLRNGVISSIRTHRGLPGSQVTALLVDHMGRLWLGVDDGLYLYDQGRFQPVLYADGRRSDMVTQLAEDRDGTIWAAEQGKVHRLLHIQGHTIVKSFPEPALRGVVSDPNGGLWMNLDDSIVHVENGSQKLLKMPPGLHIDYIEDMLSDPQGALWAVIRQGVLRFEGDKVQLLGAGNGLPCASHGTAVFDKEGSLWLTQRCGIVKVDKNSLLNWIQHPQAKVSVLHLDAFDGVQTGYSDFDPAVSRGKEGWLWFANGAVLQMLDPAHLHINTLPPPVHIEQLAADHKEIALTPHVHLPPLTRDLEIDYTALSFVMPQRVRFRYRLEGHDREWQDGGTRRSAFYTNLRPGTYKFEVIACNNSGIWNNHGDALTFVVLPAWYQTMWFLLLCVLSGVLLCYALYLLRMRQYAAAMRARFNERLDERTQIARNLHDTLLQTIQGSKMVADQAKSDLSDTAKMENYLNRLSEWLDRASIEGRAALESLRAVTSEASDLTESIRRAIEELQTKCGMAISLTVSGTPSEMHPIIGQEVLLIAYEGIGNACRHSGGKSIKVELSYDRDLRLRIRDDGHGIDEETLKAGKPGHFGLTGMRERASRIHTALTISNNPGGGTDIVLQVPGKMIFHTSEEAAGSWLGMLKFRRRR